ncbi:sulfite exporter TauE/SafE family protein [Streptomyces sp. NPDC006339]|uniref:sulfite exporter TauE/SafE family protein n=1 Tax=Streptomyces sp. NPDC006339 TaxID=3156755 RepID=UPI0033A24747
MTTLLLALIAGAVVGLALGGLGGGGSILAVPALIYLLDFTPVAATTASLVIVAATTATSLYTHAKDGNVQWRTGIPFAAAGIVPALLGGTLAGRLPEALLTGAFSVIAFVAALRMLKPQQSDADRNLLPVQPARAAATGAGLGAITGFLGVGGGFLTVPALVSVLGLKMKGAVGTSLLVITVTSLAALTARTGTAHGLRWEVIAPFTGAAILGAWDGKRLAAKVSGATLQRVFALVLAAVAGVMLLDALT